MSGLTPYVHFAGTARQALEGVMFALLGTADPHTLTGWFDQLSDGGRIVDRFSSGTGTRRTVR